MSSSLIEAIAYLFSASEVMAEQSLEVEAQPFYDPVFMAKPNQNYELVQTLIKDFIKGGRISIQEDPKYRDLYECADKTSFQNSTPLLQMNLLKVFPEVVSGHMSSMKVSIMICNPEHQKFIEYINMRMQKKGKGILIFIHLSNLSTANTVREISLSPLRQV